MPHAPSPLARPFPAMPPIAGVTPHVARAHYTTWDRCDLTFVALAAGDMSEDALADWFRANI